MTLTALLAAASMATTTPVQTTHGYLDLQPTDDVWVYPHASEPEKDPYLRAWGIDGHSVPAKDDPGQEFSLSYMKFDLKDWPSGERIQSATLLLVHAPNPSFTPEIAKQFPVEVRGLDQDFTEKTWNYTMFENIRPSNAKDAVFGSAFPAPWEKDKAFRVEIDLLKGPAKFEEFVNAALKSANKTLRIAICSNMDPSAGEGRSVYKFFSKDGEAVNRPILKIKFEHETRIIR